MNNTPTVDSATGPQSAAAKYREVIIAILIFIFLDAGVLVLNFFISFQIQGDAVSVNLSGRQRMLTQRTVKALFQYQAQEMAGADSSKTLEELVGAYDLFDATLLAFANGGATKGGDGKAVAIPRVEDPAARKPLEQALEIWTSYKTRIKAVLDHPRDPEAISAALAAASEENLKLLQLMNQFTSALEQSAKNKASMLRTIQTVALILVLINFVIIIVHVIGKLKRSDRAVQEYSEHLGVANAELESTNVRLATITSELTAAKEESDTIFSTVRQGLFLIDREFRIGSQISQELKAIFQTDQFEGRSILHLLKPLITEKQFQTVNDFFQLLLDPARRDKHLVKFNPLKRVECHFPQGEKGFQIKHLEFTFQRIGSPSNISSVLVTVSDVTESVNLSARLKAIEEKKEKQFELLIGILHVEPSGLANFIQQANTEIGAINAVLREQEIVEPDARMGRAKLDRIFRSVHNIKGNAAFLGLELLEKHAHRMEDKLGELRGLGEVTGRDFLPIVVDLAELQSALEELSELASRLSGLRRNFAPPANLSGNGASASSPAQTLASTIEDLGLSLASKLGKKVKFDCQLTGFDELAGSHRELIKDTLIQLVRNSLVHGIETPAVRQQLGKSQEGMINVACNRSTNGADHFILNYSDDGSGLRLDRIKNRAVQSGLAAPEQVEHLSPEELCGFIFEPGFSTAENATTDAGRGVGLDIIKTKVVDELGGEINFDFMPQRYCAFTISLPA